MRSLTVIILALVSVPSKCIFDKGEPVLDVNGDPVVTGRPYYLRLVDRSGRVIGGLTYKPKSLLGTLDYLMKTKGSDTKGTSFYFWELGAVWDLRDVFDSNFNFLKPPSDQPNVPLDTTTTIQVQLSNSNHKGYTVLEAGSIIRSNNSASLLWLNNKAWTGFMPKKVQLSEDIYGYTLGYQFLKSNGLIIACLTVVETGSCGKELVGLKYFGLKCPADEVIFHLYPTHT